MFQNESSVNLKSGKERNYQRMNTGNKYFSILNRKIFPIKI
jgi:hypothetical protein